MLKHEEFNIKSEILKTHWNLIYDTYITAKEKYKECNSKNNFNKAYWKYSELFDFFIYEWKSIYSKFVILPIENKVSDLFFTIQTKSFEKENNKSEATDIFCIYYCLFQYFYIFASPGLEDDNNYKDLLRLEIKTDSPNLLLYIIFGELWNELNEDNDTEFGDFSEFDLSDFYEFEVRSLQVFLSNCWNEIKSKTGSTTIATLSEATGADVHYSLDENRILSDKELSVLLNID